VADERTVAVLGLGYVGLPLVCAAVEAGHRLIGSERLAACRDSGRLQFTCDQGDLRRPTPT
jgi:hypothetical protein